MADQNNDNVVFNNPGSGIPDQPMHHYPMQPNYNLNPEGYAGYSNYINSRGDDSKYGSVPRFDTLPYEQFQPYGGYAQPSPYGGYPQPSPYGQPYPGQNYPQNSVPSGYGYGSQYPSDPYQQYDQVYDWQQSTGQIPQLRPADPYHMSENSQFPSGSPQGYNSPRIYPGYDPYAPGERRGIELSDVVNDIIGNRGQPAQRPYVHPPDFQNARMNNSDIYPDQFKNQGAYTQSPTEYMPSGSFGAHNVGSPSAPDFETAVFSLDDIQRQQANSQLAPDMTTGAQPVTTLDFNIPLDKNPQQASAMPHPPAHQQAPGMPLPPAAQQQPFDPPFSQSFGESFVARHTADFPLQGAVPQQDMYGSAPFSGTSAPPQQQPDNMSGQFKPLTSDSDMDSLFGSVFNNENSKAAVSNPNAFAGQPGLDFAMPFPVDPSQQPPVNMQGFSAGSNPQAPQPQADMPMFHNPQESASGFPQTPMPQGFPPQYDQLSQPMPQTNSGIDFYPNVTHTTLEQDFTNTADFDNNIFDSNFQIDEPSKTERAPAPTVRDTEIFRIAEELSQAVLIKSRSRSFNDNNIMKEDTKRLVQVDGMSSDYYISEGGTNPYRMFENISFGLNAGSCCALVCDVPLAAYVLARSICESADQDYEDEPVRVADTADGEAGQIMYIGSDSMLPDEMNVEDFLLYTQTCSGDDENARERLKALLSQLGMSTMQDTDLRELSYNKRILLVTLASALNPNIVCIVINDPKFRVEAEEEMLARRIFSLINNRGKCSLIACSSAYLMSSVANRVAVVKHGQLEFFGEYTKFLDDYCLGIMSFNSVKPNEVTRQLEAKYPDINVLCQENLVYLVKKKDRPDVDLATLIKDVINLGADYNSIVMDEKSFVMACKEALGKDE